MKKLFTFLFALGFILPAYSSFAQEAALTPAEESFSHEMTAAEKSAKAKELDETAKEAVKNFLLGEVDPKIIKMDKTTRLEKNVPNAVLYRVEPPRWQKFTSPNKLFGPDAKYTRIFISEDFYLIVGSMVDGRGNMNLAFIPVNLNKYLHDNYVVSFAIVENDKKEVMAVIGRKVLTPKGAVRVKRPDFVYKIGAIEESLVKVFK